MTAFLVGRASRAKKPNIGEWCVVRTLLTH